MLIWVEILLTSVFSLKKKKEKAGWRHLLRRAEEGAITQPTKERVIQTVPYKEDCLWRNRERRNKVI